MCKLKTASEDERSPRMSRMKCLVCLYSILKPDRGASVSGTLLFLLAEMLNVSYTEERSGHFQFNPPRPLSFPRSFFRCASSRGLG